MKTYLDKIKELKKAIAEADCIFIGAGAGLSTANLMLKVNEAYPEIPVVKNNSYDFIRACPDSFYPHLLET